MRAPGRKPYRQLLTPALPLKQAAGATLSLGRAAGPGAAAASALSRCSRGRQPVMCLEGEHHLQHVLRAAGGPLFCVRRRCPQQQCSAGGAVLRPTCAAAPSQRAGIGGWFTSSRFTCETRLGPGWPVGLVVWYAQADKCSCGSAQVRTLWSGRGGRAHRRHAGVVDGEDVQRVARSLQNPGSSMQHFMASWVGLKPKQAGEGWGRGKGKRAPARVQAGSRLALAERGGRRAEELLIIA